MKKEWEKRAEAILYRYMHGEQCLYQVFVHPDADGNEYEWLRSGLEREHNLPPGSVRVERELSADREAL